jgi:uncharacterized protein YdeI (YjbR/CyaY-like superfamily)
MKLGKTLHVTTREEWQSWLADHHDSESEIWLVYHKNATGKPRISYNDAVEEALCYGWIDSIQKGIDEGSFAQRFSPRRPTSRLSEMNRERIRRLIAEGRMTEIGLRAVAHVFDPTSDAEEPLVIAPDILEPLQANEEAWKNFQAFSEGYKRVRIGYIESRRRHGVEAFRRSLDHFIVMTTKNRKIGMVR